MIARTWRGWASSAAADAYQHHYQHEVREELASVEGFRGARLLRRVDGDRVEFTSITYFTGLDAIYAFAGADAERAVVDEAARRVLSDWDERVVHHDVVVVLD